MACPTCTHTMAAIGKLACGRQAWHCSRCGTLKIGVESPAVSVPALVAYSRSFGFTLHRPDFNSDSVNNLRALWRTLGIDEATAPPEFRHNPTTA